MGTAVAATEDRRSRWGVPKRRACRHRVAVWGHQTTGTASWSGQSITA